MFNGRFKRSSVKLEFFQFQDLLVLVFVLGLEIVVGHSHLLVVKGIGEG